MDLFNPGLDPVEPVRPIAPYIGGKKQLSARICEIIRTIPHETYVEPFIGMGGVFLRRDRRPRYEVINDLSGDVANLFRILQRHYAAFVGELRFSITARAHFVRLQQAAPETLTDIERAARFLYLQRLAFGGKVTGRNFGAGPTVPGRFNLSTLEPMLADVHERLAGVVIEQLPFAQLIDVYDRPATLFYLDPPYWGSETDYGKNIFAPTDFTTISERLARLQGEFIVSLNDTPEVREIFAAFTMIAVEITYSVSGEKTPAKEVIILSNGAARACMGG